MLFFVAQKWLVMLKNKKITFLLGPFYPLKIKKNTQKYHFPLIYDILGGVETLTKMDLKIPSLRFYTLKISDNLL